MTDLPADAPARLRALARTLVPRSYSPFSQRPAAAALLLDDGAWIPGVRVESASYGLTIPAVLNAVTTAIALGRRDVAAIALSRPFTGADLACLDALPERTFVPFDAGLLVAEGATWATPGTQPLSPTLAERAPGDPADGLALARTIAGRAHVPESAFPVGCVAETTEGALIPGVNVEQADWTRILCAERNVLGTLQSYGLGAPRALYVICTREPGCTPCGACRQLIAELSPDAVLWMDQSSPGARSARPRDLLPDFFSGASLVRTID